jgi:putative ABC transport system ATP-binding protein
MTVMIALSDLHRRYRAKLGSTPVLRGVDLEVEKGEFVAICGAPGSGKTTLLRVLAALDRPDSGSVALLGKDIRRLSERDRATLRGSRIGVITQKPQLLMSATVLRNVAFPLAYAGMPAVSRTARALSALRYVRLEEFAARLCRDLTADQQQRVQIARAIVNDPEIILADEPLGPLDQASRDLVLKLFADQKGLRRTVVVVSQDSSTTHLADTCYLLEDGALTVHPLMWERMADEEEEDEREDIYQALLEVEEEAKTIFEYPIDWAAEADALSIPIVFSLDEALAGSFVKETWWRR